MSHFDSRVCWRYYVFDISRFRPRPLASANDLRPRNSRSRLIWEFVSKCIFHIDRNFGQKVVILILIDSKHGHFAKPELFRL